MTSSAQPKPRPIGGDVDYDETGNGYATMRRPDPSIGALVAGALDTASSVVNVGAGAGSYEPPDRRVVAVEPSRTMRAQRPAGSPPVIAAFAEQLPFPDGAFAAAMAMVTVHQWSDLDAGLREMRRVASGPVVVLTFEGETLHDFWLASYAPELMDAERRRMPPLAHVAEVLGGAVEIAVVPINFDCTDGFTEAFYGRPEEMLRPEVRRAQSAWGFVPEGAEERAVAALRRDLSSGAWDAAYGALRTQPTYAGALRLIVARPRP